MSELNPFTPPKTASHMERPTQANVRGVWSLRLLLASILLALIGLTLSLLPETLTGGVFDSLNPFSTGRWIMILFCAMGVAIALWDLIRKNTNKWLVGIGLLLNFPLLILLLWI